MIKISPPPSRAVKAQAQLSESVTGSTGWLKKSWRKAATASMRLAGSYTISFFSRSTCPPHTGPHVNSCLTELFHPLAAGNIGKSLPCRSSRSL